MTIHIIGAGLSGLAAAVCLADAGVRVSVYEAAAQAGGRCRSYFDREVGRVIDNGNHLLLSGNENALRYLRLLGAEDRLIGPAGEGGFRFLDLTSNRDFVVRPNAGPAPWWIAVPGRRIPGTRAFDYLCVLKLALVRPGATVAEALPHDELFRVLWEPLAVSALNTPVAEASARGFWQVLVRTLVRGGKFAQPLIARDNLGDTFIAPALDFLGRKGGEVRFGARVRRILYAERSVAGLALEEGQGSWQEGDGMILAAPPSVAERLVPRLETPCTDEPIVNAHFATKDGDGVPLEIVAIVGGAAQWVFRRPGLTSVTVSAARAMVELPAETLAPLLWADVARAFPALGQKMPAYRIIKEKRATIRQSPTDQAARPPAATSYDNLWLAGDWTATGLPATIEGSIVSGFKAAKLALASGSR